MSNIVHLNIPSRTQRLGQRQAALLTTFARERRVGDDVFWLKENAEMLSILECTKAHIAREALQIHAGFYSQIERRLGFFPQYYRFLLSMCLDLEDLGMAGDKGTALVEWSCKQGLAQAELSDLQRAEARRLMQRRGYNPMAADPGLDDRLRAFVSQPSTFAIPNKKAAYELTHIVFYLSEYGRKSPGLGDEVRRSLDFAGTLAFLDHNADLLAEVCVAMRYAGFYPSEIWEDWLRRHLQGFDVETGDTLSVQDDYHEFLVCNWAMAVAGGQAFVRNVTHGRMRFGRPASGYAPLRHMSECLFDLAARLHDWGAMRRYIVSDLSDHGQEHLVKAEEASQDFDAFFAHFARIDTIASDVRGNCSDAAITSVQGQRK